MNNQDRIARLEALKQEQIEIRDKLAIVLQREQLARGAGCTPLENVKHYKRHSVLGRIVDYRRRLLADLESVLQRATEITES